MKQLLLSVLGLLCVEAARAQTCDCAADLRFARQAYEQNYAGFAHALARRGAPAYQHFADSLQQNTQPITDLAGCEKALRRYLRYFGDGHATLAHTGAYQRLNNLQLARRKRPSLEVLDEHAVLLTIPSADSSQQKLVDSLLTANKARLARTPYLLVDVRGNGGGNARVFLSLLELLYTRPVVLDGVAFRSSPRNLAMFRAGLATPGLPADVRKRMSSIIARMEASPTGFVPGQPGRTITLGKHRVQAYPKRVSILMDHRCASATEEFLLAARQSSKVTLFGQPTAGTLDYADLYLEPLPSGLFAVSIPMSRSLRLPDRPFDANGMKPDVPVPGWEFDWADFVRRYWQEKS
ncbi:S41 family peptidase [Hymenobacter properus]|uniref:Tail specific protease domain-containing protein n=1 Tax=Hymenobacter properus TaxID=2791026 RepID=A0A931BQ16_9BACT|nr:S41 family peptidase [Hymenobacter properus]MBF9143515.1 hypothetical protein [Hymenobacter properus]MBR7722328.1 hypothetical protein [Microvirga sp. SRT04]